MADADYVDVEVEANPNSGDEEVSLRFKALEPARRLRRARVGDQVCDVVGWQPAGPCAALAQRVDDSGEGTVWLVRGGRWGLRLRPADAPGDWDLDDARQFGEPYLKLASGEDLELE